MGFIRQIINKQQQQQQKLKTYIYRLSFPWFLGFICVIKDLSLKIPLTIKYWALPNTGHFMNTDNCCSPIMGTMTNWLLPPNDREITKHHPILWIAAGKCWALLLPNSVRHPLLCTAAYFWTGMLANTEPWLLNGIQQGGFWTWPFVWDHHQHRQTGDRSPEIPD